MKNQVYALPCVQFRLTLNSGRSRISRWGAPTSDTYAKTKEIDPVGGGAHAAGAPWIRQCLTSKIYYVSRYFSYFAPN